MFGKTISTRNMPTRNMSIIILTVFAIVLICFTLLVTSIDVKSGIYEENCEILAGFDGVSIEECLILANKNSNIYGWEAVKTITGDNWINTEWTGYNAEKRGAVIDNSLLTDHNFGEFPVYMISK